MLLAWTISQWSAIQGTQAMTTFKDRKRCTPMGETGDTTSPKISQFCPSLIVIISKNPENNSMVRVLGIHIWKSLFSLAHRTKDIRVSYSKRRVTLI